jgi:hypothetical protein
MLPRPMPLIRVVAPFDHLDWLYELKHDEFRALAHIEGHSLGAKCHAADTSTARTSNGIWAALNEELFTSRRFDTRALAVQSGCNWRANPQ